MTIHNDELAFDYLTSNSEQFFKDFMDYVVTDVPLFALQDELLYHMNKRNKTSFKIPGYKCIDGRDHIFYFTIDHINFYQKTKIFHYIGIDTNTKAK